MKMRATLSDSPERIEDIGILTDALHTLQTLEKKHGVTYEYVVIQDKLGGTCKPVPVNYKPGYGSEIISRFDAAYFSSRLNGNPDQTQTRE